MAKSRKKKESDPLSKDMSYLIHQKEKWVRLDELFHLQPKNKSITLRLSEDLLKEVKKLAEEEKTDYQKLIRQAIIDLITKKAS